jgi:hypothetical protein
MVQNSAINLGAICVPGAVADGANLYLQKRSIEVSLIGGF